MFSGSQIITDFLKLHATTQHPKSGFKGDCERVKVEPRGKTLTLWKKLLKILYLKNNIQMIIFK